MQRDSISELNRFAASPTANTQCTWHHLKFLPLQLFQFSSFLLLFLSSCIHLLVQMKVRGDQLSTSWPEVQSSPHYTDTTKTSDLKDIIHFPLGICVRPQKSNQMVVYSFLNIFYSSQSLFQATLYVTCQTKCRWVFPDFKFKLIPIS